MKVLLLAKYGRLAASTRLRSLQYLPGLAQTGVEVEVQSLLSDRALLERYTKGRYTFKSVLYAYMQRARVLFGRHKFNLIWIEKEAFPWWPLWLEKLLVSGVPYVLDYDDADFHYYDRHRWAWVRKLFGRRLDGLMAGAELVLAGNGYLAQRARDAGARWVEILPTVIDIDRYPNERSRPLLLSPEIIRVVWIGSPCTVHYLSILQVPLARLAEHMPFVLRVIGAEALELEGVQIETINWHEDTEAQNIRDCDIGIMPLLDAPFEQGKCGYKLIQYMACGLPVVASSVGANLEIVQQEVTGFLAKTQDDWYAALMRLMNSDELRHQLGAAGRQRVAERYCLQQTGPLLKEFLVKAGQQSNL